MNKEQLRRQHVARIASIVAFSFCIGCSNEEVGTGAGTSNAVGSSHADASSSQQTTPQAQQDYVDFRSQFRTTLTRKGPSPQQADRLSVPAGASKLTYSSDQNSLLAFMALPKGAPVDSIKEFPAVVFLHGGFAFGEGDWEMVTPYLNSGFAVMIPILRAENYQPGIFTLYYDEVDDVLAATEEFSKHPQIDSQRIFIAGHSAGGTLAALSSMASDRYRAVASFSGTMDSRSEEKTPLLVFDLSDPEELKARSPLHFSGSFKSPTRLYHGSQEQWAVEETHATAQNAAARGLDVKAVMIPGDHFSSVPAAMQDSIRFFESKL